MATHIKVKDNRIFLRDVRNYGPTVSGSNNFEVRVYNSKGTSVTIKCNDKEDQEAALKILDEVCLDEIV